MGRKEFDDKGETEGLMVQTKNTIWETGKVVIMESGFCVLEWLILMVERGILGSALIKK